MIDRAQIEHLAGLARLNLTEGEKERFGTQLGDILAYINKLSALDVSGVEPMTGAIPVTNVFRDDVEHISLAQDDALANAPERVGTFFKVPRIIESGEGAGGDETV